MKWFAEITKWSDNTPNHIYLLNDSKSTAYAYVRAGQNQAQVFKTPLTISSRGRKFQPVPDRWHVQVRDDKPRGRLFVVKGSRGDEYRVTEANGSWSCTCSGFRFRGDCKHVKALSHAA